MQALHRGNAHAGRMQVRQGKEMSFGCFKQTMRPERPASFRGHGKEERKKDRAREGRPSSAGPERRQSLPSQLSSWRVVASCLNRVREFPERKIRNDLVGNGNFDNAAADSALLGLKLQLWEDRQTVARFSSDNRHASCREFGKAGIPVVKAPAELAQRCVELLVVPKWCAQENPQAKRGAAFAPPRSTRIGR